MSTTLGFKDLLDLPVWQPIANSITVSAAGTSWACDLRNSEDRHPILFALYTNAVLNAYNVKNDEWMTLTSPALVTTFGAGAGCVFAPSQGPAGTIAAGATTTTVTLSTALPAAVAINQLANRGDGRGFKMRIIDNIAAASGKTEEVTITYNTSGTTPVITFTPALSFTPATGARYEILSGRVFLLGASTTAAGIWKYYDVATNSYSGNLATTNLPATISTDSSLIALDEAHVPNERAPYEGFFNRITATASGASSITGPAGSGDYVALVNEYRNFQIRIVEDASTPTAAGQRRRITSHTAGPSVVYTVAAWAVTPSATAKYVVENDNDKIVLWTSASANTHCYNITANTWDTTTFAVRPAVMAAGCTSQQAFGLTLTTNRTAQHSFVYSTRGGAVSTLDLFDISGAATGAWTGAITYGGSGLTTWGGGTCSTYDAATMGGRYMYLNQTALQRNYRFDMQNRVLEPFGFNRYPQSTAIAGERLAYTVYIDGATKLGFIYQQRATGAETFRLALTR